MKLFKSLALISTIWLAALLFAVNANSDTPDLDSTLTKVGEISPVLSVHTTNNQKIDFKGKVVVLSFFATWCGPCMEEMPHLEKSMWQPLKDKGLVLIAVGREHSESEVKAFQKSKNYTFQFTADPKREIYGKFAKEFIPRCVVIGKDGNIKYQSIGYSEKEFPALVEAVKQELGK